MPCYHSTHDGGLNSVSRACYSHSPSCKAKKSSPEPIKHGVILHTYPPHTFSLSPSFHFVILIWFLLSSAPSVFLNAVCSFAPSSHIPSAFFPTSSVSYCLSPIYSPHPLKWDWKVPLFSPTHVHCHFSLGLTTKSYCDKEYQRGQSSRPTFLPSFLIIRFVYFSPSPFTLQPPALLILSFFFFFGLFVHDCR